MLCYLYRVYKQKFVLTEKQKLAQDIVTNHCPNLPEKVCVFWLISLQILTTKENLSWL